jgi:1-acyl-sn-glycerol-3-phosphate acyltransferase
VVDVARSRRGPVGFWIRLCVLVIWPLIGAFFKVRWRNRERVPATGGVILATNHVSYADPLVFARFVWDSGRIPRFLIKDSLFQVFFIRSVLHGAQQIPVSRGSVEAEQSIRHAVGALERGECVCIYPEGTVTRDPDFWPMVGHTGVARLALGTDVPVVPVAQWGPQQAVDVYHKRYRPFPRKEAYCIAGEPLDLSAYRGRPLTAELLREVTDLIMGAVRAELAGVRGEPAPAAFYRRPPAAREAS